MTLASVEGEIETEYARSLALLQPIKHDLARTDALIDRIVYRLYGLTDAEIELIERPQYEQALAAAKTRAVADAALADDDARIAQIGAGVLRAATQFFARVEPGADEATLDAELPGWRTLPPAAPTFLRTGEYNLRTLPEQMDFSTSVVSYTKAVEVTLYQRIFAPFRASGRYSDADCQNTFLRDFMLGRRHLTLGNFMIILASSKETALRSFVAEQISDAGQRVFGAQGLVQLLGDSAIRDTRNDAAHDEVLSRADAQRVRTWALGVLALV